MGVQYCHPMKLSGAVKTWLLWLALSAAIFPIICCISYVGLMIYGSQRREAVTSPAPPQFPILVITSHYVASKELLTPLDHAPTAACVAAERAVVLRLNGDCHSPIAAFATIDAAGQMALRAAVGARDGEPPVLKASIGGPAKSAESLADRVFEDLSRQGVQAILGGGR